MNSIHNKIKHLIESIVESVLLEEPEAPEDAVFGRYLFAPNRKDLSGNEKFEKDTPDEVDFKNSLNNWYDGDVTSSGLEDMASDIFDAIENGEYKKILTPPKSTRTYRWLNNISLYEAAEILAVDIDFIIDRVNKLTLVRSPGVLMPYDSNFQSWTINPEKLDQIVLTDLAYSLINSGKISLLVESNTDLGQFFMNPKGIKDVDHMSDYAYTQDEVISYGSVDLVKAVFLYNSSYDSIRINTQLIQDFISELR